MLTQKPMFFYLFYCAYVVKITAYQRFPNSLQYKS